LLKIGAYINQRPDAGGGYYESLNSIGAIANTGYEIEYFTSNKACQNALRESGRNCTFIKIGIVARILLFFRYQILNIASRIVPGNSTFVRLIKKFIPYYNLFEKPFINREVDMIFFVSPETNAIYIENINYCFSVWDLAHVDIPYYPELRGDFTFESRDFLYSRVLPKAYAIIVGHENCRSSIIQKYNISEEKIFIVPFQASPLIRKNHANCGLNDLTRNRKLDPYLFYPSQYSPHKNHRYVLDAFSQFVVRRPDTNLKLIFNGKDSGSYHGLQKLSREKNLQNRISYLPFQTDEKVYQLYKDAAAVIVPTHIGPGTLPSLEALYMNKLLILPKYKFNEQYYCEFALYYDPYDTADLIKIMSKICDNTVTKDQIDRNIKYFDIQERSELPQLIEHINQFSLIKKAFCYG
jgi:glycosyltransferase involved in cell wall biosynthesis